MVTLHLLEYKIEFAESVLNIFDKFVQNTNYKKEAGGILLGQVSNKSIYIIKASVPNRFDIATRYSFHRDKNIAQIIVNHEFYNSMGKTIYLGEWHTHPEDYASPSSQDIKMIKGQMKLGKLNESFALLVIRGIIGTYVGILKNDLLEGKIICN